MKVGIYKYYLKISSQPERESTLDEFIEAERAANFTGPGHFLDPPSPATHSFGAEINHPKLGRIKIKGRVEYVHE